MFGAMARWFGYSLSQTRELLLTEFWMLDGFLARHPPADLLMAWQMNWKPTQTAAGPGARPSMAQAKKANSEALKALPPRRKMRTLAQMPAFLRSPEQLALIERMKAECQTS